MIDYIGAVLTSGFKLYDNNFVMSIFSGPSVIQHFHVAHFALGENVLQVKNAFFCYVRSENPPTKNSVMLRITLESLFIYLI